MRTHPFGWTDVGMLADALANRVRETPGSEKLRAVYGVPRGGVPVAMMVGQALGLPLMEMPTHSTSGGHDLDPRHVLVVDDIADSGRTAQRFVERGHPFDALLRRAGATHRFAPCATLLPADAWALFPWEMGEDREGGGVHGPGDAVTRLLSYIGEDPNREGLRETPARVVKALREMTAGYALDPAKVLSTVFTERCDEMVVVKGIEFTSLCEHHMLPFVGTAVVGYVPNGKVVGLSKLARLVDMYAQRLQVQERLTSQVTDAMVAVLQPLGAGTVISARHACMGCRGVKKPGAVMTTSALAGILRTDEKARAEFLAHAR